MKRLLTLALILAMSFTAIAGCTKRSDKNDNNEEVVTSAPENNVAADKIEKIKSMAANVQTGLQLIDTAIESGKLNLSDEQVDTYEQAKKAISEIDINAIANSDQAGAAMDKINEVKDMLKSIYPDLPL